MKDILLAGVDLDADAALELLKRLNPERVRYRRSESIMRAEGVEEGADLSALQTVASGQELDVIELPAGLSIKRFRMIASDMDSTLIVNESIDDMAFAAGCYDEVADLTRRAMEGSWSFDESLRNRVACLKGASTDVIDHAINAERLTHGAEMLMKLCRRNGLHAYIISGGFSQVCAAAVKKLGMSGAVCNELVIEDGKLTGEVTGPAGGRILNADGKRRAMEILAQTNGLSLSQVIAVGDGANDAEMIAAAGLGVGFHPKPYLASRAKASIRHGGLEVLAHFFVESWTDAPTIYKRK